MRRSTALAAFLLALALCAFPGAALADEVPFRDGGSTGIALTTEVPERRDDEPATDDAGQGRDEGGRDLPTTGDPSAGMIAAALALLAASGTLLVSAGSMLLGRDESEEDS
jgi:hypothetical protein